MRLLVVMALAIASPVAAGNLIWNMQTMAGYDSNPSGLSAEDAQATNWSSLKLGWSEAVGEGTVALAYNGDLYAYNPNTDWVSHHHGVSATLAWPFASGIYQGVMARVNQSWNRDIYSAYDYREFGGQFWTRLGGRTLPTTLSVGYARRAYEESPEFDYDQLTLSAGGSKSFRTRTTVAVSGAYNLRSYRVTTLEDMLLGREDVTSDQVSLGLRVSQGLTETTGLKFTGWFLNGDGESRWRDDYWQSMDDPLSSSGFGGRGQVSWLIPAGMTLRTYVGAQRLERSYVDAMAYQATRIDKSGEFGVVLEGLLPWPIASRALDWSIEARAVRQNSDDPDYSYNRLSIMGGFSYRW